MKRQAIRIAAVMALVAGSVLAEGMEPSAKAASVDFTRMKALAGVWTGTGTMEATGQPVRVEYRVTAAGSAVIETLFPGTHHEMVSVYYDKNGTLFMTHYCAFGNRPQMTVKKSTAHMLEMELAPGGEIAADRETHMHAVKFTFEGPDKMTTEWTAFEAGKKKSVSSFTLTRQK